MPHFSCADRYHTYLFYPPPLTLTININPALTSNTDSPPPPPPSTTTLCPSHISPSCLLPSPLSSLLGFESLPVTRVLRVFSPGIPVSSTSYNWLFTTGHRIEIPNFIPPSQMERNYSIYNVHSAITNQWRLLAATLSLYETSAADMIFRVSYSR